MNEDTKITSKSGDGSTTIQAKEVVIQQGSSYSEIKEIAKDVFKQNFLTLRDEASSLAIERANEFTIKLVEELKIRKPDTMQNAKTPGFQYALYEAQKNFAKTGDKDMAEVLVDILIDRLEFNDRNLRQIVLDESIGIIPKLTSSQLDVLTLVFLLKRSVNYGINNDETLKDYLDKYIKPFTDSLSKESSLYEHLAYTGCSGISIGSNSIEDIFKNNYKGLFFSGFKLEDYKKITGETTDYDSFVIKCFNDEAKYQLNFLNKEILDKKIIKKNVPTKISQKIIQLFNQNILPDAKIKLKLIALSDDYMNNLFETWTNSSMKNLVLTSVGIAIAQANYRRKTGVTIDLSIWIK